MQLAYSIRQMNFIDEEFTTNFVEFKTDCFFTYLTFDYFLNVSP